MDNPGKVPFLNEIPEPFEHQPNRVEFLTSLFPPSPIVGSLESKKYDLANETHLQLLREWITGIGWSREVHVYAVGSVLDGKPVQDLDVVITPRHEAPIPWRTCLDVMLDLRSFGLHDLNIMIDPSYCCEPQDIVERRAFDGEVFETWKLRSPYWDRRVRYRSAGVYPFGPYLVRIARRLRDTNYYEKLPLGRWRGNEQRVWRSWRLLDGEQTPESVGQTTRTDGQGTPVV